MSSADKDILYRVAYDEAVRALSEQQLMIDSFRSRTGLLLSAAAITTSFLGAQALKIGDLSPPAWLGSGATRRLLPGRQRPANCRGDPMDHRHRINRIGGVHQ
jgi:hypothetical protein